MSRRSRCSARLAAPSAELPGTNARLAYDPRRKPLNSGDKWADPFSDTQLEVVLNGTNKENPLTFLGAAKKKNSQI